MNLCLNQCSGKEPDPVLFSSHPDPATTGGFNSVAVPDFANAGYGS